MLLMNILAWKSTSFLVIISMIFNSVPSYINEKNREIQNPSIFQLQPVKLPTTVSPNSILRENSSPILSSFRGLASETLNQDKHRLVVSVNPAIYIPGKPVELSWIVKGLSKTPVFKDARILISLPVGLQPNLTDPAVAVESNGTISIPWNPNRATLVLNPSSGIKLPIIIPVELQENGKRIDIQTVEIYGENKGIMQKGGIQGQDRAGQVTLNVNRDAVDEDVILDIRPPVPYKQPAFSLSWNPVEIVAVGRTSGRNITRFKKSVPITIKYDRSRILGGNENDLIIYYYDEELRDWIPLPTEVKKDKQELTAYTDHLTVFDYQATSWQAYTAPTVDNFKSDRFSGSATFDYPIWTPPGPAGLKPELSLTYNSQIIDESTIFTQASWVGMGWNLDTGSITYNMSTDTYSIIVNGTSSLILPVSGSTYNTVDQSFIKIVREGSTWTAYGKDGKVYIFGNPAMTYFYNGCVQAANLNIPWNWPLVTERDRNNNEISYTYQKTIKGTANNCANEIDIFPVDVTYAGGKYRVHFIPEIRHDFRISTEAPNSRINHSFYRLSEIQVQSSSDGTNWQNIRRYDLVYADGGPGQIYPGFNWQAAERTDHPIPEFNHPANPPKGYTATLARIDEYGNSSESLPPTTFSYGDNLHLTDVNNGQGGRIQMGYTPWSYTDDINTETRSILTRFGEYDEECYRCIDYELGTVWQPLIPGQPATCFSSDLRVGLPGQYAPAIGFRTIPEQLLKIGYPYRFNIQATYGSSATPPPQSPIALGWGVRDRNISSDESESETWGRVSSIALVTDAELNRTLKVPVTSSVDNLVMQLYCSGSCTFSKVQYDLLPTYYRVNSRTVIDDVTGKSTTYQYIYDNSSPNTEGTSEIIKTNGTAKTDLGKYFTLPMMEYRGSSMSMEENSEGLSNINWYYQSDALKGRLFHSLTLQKTFADSLESETANAWVHSSGTTEEYSYAQKEKVDFDKSWKMINSSANWDKALGRGNFNLTNGMATISHIRLSERTAGANSAGLYAGLSMENPGGDPVNRFGVMIQPDGSGHSVHVQYNLGNGSQDAGVLIPDDQFQMDKWYVLMLLLDSSNGSLIKMWQVDHPEINAEYRLPTTPSGNWRYVQNVNDGISWLDSYIEGRIQSETETNFSTVIQYDTEEYNVIPQLEMISFSIGKKDLLVTWSYPTETINRTFENSSLWYGTRENYGYLPEDQNYEQFGNVTRTVVSYSLGDEWTYHHASLSKYYPQTGSARMLADLPARQLTLDCRTGCDFTGRTGLLAETLYYYDNSNEVVSRPVTGRLTMQRNRVKLAGQYTQTNTAYDTYGNVTGTTTYADYATSTANPAGGMRTLTRTYDPLYHAYPLTETNAINQSTSTTYDYTLGVPLTVTDANGNKTGAAYDSFGRMTAVCAPGDWDGVSPCSTTNGTTLLISYSNYSNGYPAGVYLTQRLDTSRGMQFARYYNGLGNQIQTQTIGAEVNGSTANVVVDNLYDNLGRLSKQVKPYTYDGNPAYQSQVDTRPSVTITYDVFGRVIRVEEPDGTGTSNTFGHMQSTQFDAKNHASTTRVDVWGRVAAVLPQDGPELHYQYDMLNNLVQVAKGSGTAETITVMAYDLGGRKTAMSDPDMGIWMYNYDALGELIQQHDARGCSTSLAYDNLGRPAEKTYGGPCSETAPVRYYYDGETFSFLGSTYGASANAIGRRTGMTDGSGAAVWTYDARGNRLSERKLIFSDPVNTSAETFDTQWAYNSADLPVSMSYPDGEVVNQTYNDQGQLNGVQNSGGFTYLQNLVYDESGRQRTISLGASGQTPVLSRQLEYTAWDQGGRLSSMFTRNLFNVDLQNLRYTYDANGNITTIHDVSNRSEISSFSYDSLDRLTGQTVTGEQNNVVLTENFTYDEAGRLSGKARDGQSVTLGYAEDHPHAVAEYGENTYTYDENGNQVTRDLAGGQFALSYDGENHLVDARPAALVTPTATPTQTATATTNTTPQPTATTQTGAGPGKYDDSYGGITYTGLTGQSGYNGLYYGTYHWTYGSIFFPFHGIGVTWGFFRNWEIGAAEVFIDGVKVDEVGLNDGSTLNVNQTWTSPLLEDGNHTLEIRRTYIYAVVDYFTVYGSGETVPTTHPVAGGEYGHYNWPISCGGLWYGTADIRDFSGGVRYTSDLGSMALLTFTGERITYKYRLAPNGGTAEIYIDDQKVDEISNYGNLTYRQEWRSQPLPYGKHRLKIRNKGEQYIFIDSIIVHAPEEAVGSGIYDDRERHIIFRGTSWVPLNAGGAYGDTIRLSNRIGNTAQLRFNGRQVRAIYTTASEYGVAAISIDGKPVAQVNQYSVSPMRQQQWTSGLLSAGPHTLTITHQSGIYVELDAIRVLDISTPTPTQTPTTTGIGIVDDRDARITYNGSWVNWDGEGPYANTLRYSNSVGSTAQLTFTGEQIRILYTTTAIYGTAAIYIDGSLVAHVNQYTSSTVRQQQWTSGLLSSGTHSLSIVHESGSYIELDAIIVWNSSTSTPTQTSTTTSGIDMVDDRNASIIYTGSWVNWDGEGPYANTLRYSNSVGSTAQLTFNGEQIRVLYTTTSQYGTATIYIDGNQVAQVNQYSSTTVRQQQWTSGSFSAGLHTLTIVHESGSYVELDAIAVLNSTIPVQPVVSMIYDDRDSHITYSGSWVNWDGDGPHANTLRYSYAVGSTAQLTFIGQQVRVMYTTTAQYGIAAIYIDGSRVAQINQHSSTTVRQQQWVSGLLSTGTHTLSVVHESGSYIELDAITILFLPTPTLTLTQTYTLTHTFTNTPVISSTPIPTRTSTSTFTASPTPSAAPTVTPTPIPSEPAPQGLQSAQYSYDGDGTMVRGIVNGTITFYPGRHFNKEVAAGGTKVQKFYFAGTMTIAIRTLENGTDMLNWVLGDHLGSTSATANADGSLNSVIQYTAYGEIRLTQGVTPTKYRYTGQLAQAELGLDYYVARWYDPALGHFTQADSTLSDVTNPVDYDRYSYTRNNPVRYTDSSGHCIDGLTTVACLIIIGSAVLKVVDYGWTAYDAYQSTQVLADPNSTQEEKDAAAQNLAMTAAFEVAEPDDFLPVALPLDDLARKGLISVRKEVGEEVEKQGARRFTASNFRENLQKLTRKTVGDIIDKDAHHIFPQQFIKDFTDAGIDINDPKFGTWVENNIHQDLHKTYNQEWGKFLSKKRIKVEILDFARKQAKKYGFKIEFK
jgi:RHS repeat-associated protein